MQRPADQQQALPPEEAARLRTAEDRLYPLAMVDVERYQRGTTLCGLLLDDLRATCPDIPSVLDRRTALLHRLPSLASESGVGLDGLQPDILVDAAAALRCRELQALHLHTDREERIAAARARGEEWLVEEPPPAEVMAGRWRRVELHLATGTELISTVEAGAGDLPATYSLEVAPQAGSDPDARPEVFENEDAWTRAAAAHRAEIAAQP